MTDAPDAVPTDRRIRLDVYFARMLVASCSESRYTVDVIMGFRHKGLEGFYRTGSKRGINAAHADKLSRILGALDVAQIPQDLAIPAFRTHAPKGELGGNWSIGVSGNWRVTFRFVGTEVELVDYQDYH